MVIKHYAIVSDNIRNNEANYTHYVQNEWTQIFNCKEIHKEILFKEGIYEFVLLKTCKSSIRLHQYILQES
jgi:hypothetical protein